MRSVLSKMSYTHRRLWSSQNYPPERLTKTARFSAKYIEASFGLWDVIKQLQLSYSNWWDSLPEKLPNIELLVSLNSILYLKNFLIKISNYINESNITHVFAHNHNVSKLFEPVLYSWHRWLYSASPVSFIRSCFLTSKMV